MEKFVNSISAIQKIANEFDGAISIKNSKREYFFINKYLLKALALKEEQVIGKTDDEILSPENAEIARKFDAKALETIGPIEYSREVNINGKTLNYITIKWVIRNRLGEIFCICTLADLMEHKEKVLSFREKIDSLFTSLVNT